MLGSAAEVGGAATGADGLSEAQALATRQSTRSPAARGTRAGPGRRAVAMGGDGSSDDGPIRGRMLLPDRPLETGSGASGRPVRRGDRRVLRTGVGGSGSAGSPSRLG